MRKLLKEPLVFFLLFELGLFVLFGLTGWDFAPAGQILFVGCVILLVRISLRVSRDVASGFARL